MRNHWRMGKPEPDQWSITLTPHRSLTRHGFIAVMALVAGTNFALGFIFLAIGAWPVGGFMGLDVLLVWWALRRNFADSDRAEKLIAKGDALTLQRLARKAAPSETVFNRRWVKVELEHNEARELTGRLLLRSHGKSHEIASFLGADERMSLAKALRRAI